MKYTRLLPLLLLAIFCACQKGEDGKVYQPRAIVADEDFNTYPKKENDQPFKIFKTGQAEDAVTDEGDTSGTFSVKFRDTVIAIQPDPSDAKHQVNKFAVARFMNTQETCVLVQLADSSGLVAPFYLLTLKDNQLEVVSLHRSSTGKLDKDVTKGMIRVGGAGYLINNDFFVTHVNAKVYEIKRQNPEERIQGEFFVQSPDKQTFVFLLDNAFYEVHYQSGESFTQPFVTRAPERQSALFRWTQDNYTWVKDKKGIAFLKADADDNRIVDIKEFR